MVLSRAAARRGARSPKLSRGRCLRLLAVLALASSAAAGAQEARAPVFATGASAGSAPSAAPGLSAAPAGVDAPSGAARYDPTLRFRTTSTRRFDIHFHQGEEALAARVAGFAEAVAAEVDAALGAPRGRVQVVLVDQTDQSNGFATVFPYDLIELTAAPPPSLSTIGNTDDWLRLVFAHEYTHIVHLQKGRGWPGRLRSVFGRLPLLYPNLFLPGWQIEGIATFEESRVTGQGRVPAGDFRMRLDAAAASGRLLALDRAGGGLVDWPAGDAPYLYGAYFHEYLARRYGPDALSRLAEATAGRLPYVGSRAFRDVFGQPLGALWKEFEADAASSSMHEDAVSARRLTRHGFLVAGPRFESDGAIVYSVANPHGFPALMRLPGNGGAPIRVAPRFHGEGAGLAGDEIVFDQLEVVHHVGLQGDLYAVRRGGGRARRLTRGMRAADPDVAPDGVSIACTIQSSDRRSVAVLRRPSSGRTAVPVLLVSEAATEFSAPRWSPDGRSIAAERRRIGGPSEIVVIDVATRSVRTVVSAVRGRNAGPAWTPDGRSILFASDRDGPFRIHAIHLATGDVRRLMGTGVGAHSPEVSPDGREVVFVGYTADGYDLYALRLEAASWSDPLPAPQSASSAGALLEVNRTPRLPAPAGPAEGSRRYRPWPTLAPRYWVPLLESRRDDLRVGAATSGFDALGRHAYVASASWIVPRGEADWAIDYAYARWWPTLFASASKTTDDWRSGDVRSGEVSAGVLLPLRHVRWAGTALAGVHASRDRYDCPGCEVPVAAARVRRDIRLGWQVSSARAFGYSVSAEEGALVNVTTELTPAAGLAASGTGASTADVRGYWRVFPRHAVVAARLAGATAWGDPAQRRVFEASGAGPQSAGFDFGTGAIGLLRGFRSADLFGRRAAVMNLEYRVPLAWPQRGAGTLPLMVRSLHAAGFADAGHAWDGAFRAAEVRRALGFEVSADTVLGYGLPVTVTAGAAWRDDPSGRHPGWAVFARAGRAF